jgi:hypothetical protein
MIDRQSGASARRHRRGAVEAGADSIRARGLLGILLALATLCALIAPPSQAAVQATPTYAPGAFFGAQGTGPGQFSAPGQIAVEPGTGNLLVTDTGNERVQVLSADVKGNPAFLTTLGAGTLTTPVGIAVDPGSGAIYVSDSGAGRIFRFTSDGAPTPTYTLDPTFTSPTGLASFDSTLAVDPTTHDLLVADTGSQEVRRFDVSDGHLLKAFDGAGSPGGRFTSLRGLAVAPSGTTYVLDEAYPGAVEIEGGGRVEKFDAAGDSLGQLQGTDQQGAVGVDPTNGAVLVAWHNYWENPFLGDPIRVALYEGGQTPLFSVKASPTALGTAVGLAVSAAATRPAFVLMNSSEIAGGFGAPGIEPLKPAEVPAAEVGASGPPGTTTAHLTGTVAPGTLSGPGTARFEYSLDGTDYSQTPDQPGIAGPGVTAVAAELTDLRPNTTYSIRLHISNEDFSADSAIATIATEPVVPGLEPAPVRELTDTSATLAAKVNPFGRQTTYHFEYGLSDTYGQTAPAGSEDVAGAGYGLRPAAEAIRGLEPGRTYHYRIVAHNATGTNAGADSTFTTLAEAEPGRAYEQVTPIDKHGMALNAYSAFYQAAADGDAISFQGHNAIDLPDTMSATLNPHYAAIRGADGWSFRQLDAPWSVQPGDAQPLFQSTLAISADFSHALVAGSVALTPGAIEGAGSLYCRDVQTGSFELIATGIDLNELRNHPVVYYGGNRDFSKIFLTTPEAWTSDALPGPRHLYEWKRGHGLALISRLKLPDDSEVESSVEAIQPSLPAVNYISEDAARVYFSTAEGTYLREGDDQSELITPPEYTPLLDVTPDGRFASYKNAESKVFRYDRETRSTRFVVQDAFVNMGMSDNGSSIFWSDPAGIRLSVWHQGAVVQFASSFSEFYGGGFSDYASAISPDGRYLEFATPSLAGQSYDNINPQSCGQEGFGGTPTEGHCREAYLYDAEEGTLTCVSCRADGGRSAGHAFLGGQATELSLHSAPLVDDKGQAFFDTPTSLVSADSNGRRDVYEYRDGEVRLISPGTAGFDARLADVSADGDDVFFATGEGLVGQDIDRALDLYDARVGGGLASQAAPLPSGCAVSDCRVSAPPAAAAPSAASEAVGAGPTRPHRIAKAKKHKRRHKKHRGRHRARHRGSRASVDHSLGR